MKKSKDKIQTCHNCGTRFRCPALLEKCDGCAEIDAELYEEQYGHLLNELATEVVNSGGKNGKW